MPPPTTPLEAAFFDILERYDLSDLQFQGNEMDGLLKLLSDSAEKNYRERTERPPPPPGAPTTKVKSSRKTREDGDRQLRKERKTKTGPSKPNNYSKFVRLVAGISQYDAPCLLNGEWNAGTGVGRLGELGLSCTEITFTPAPITGDKAKAHWDTDSLRSSRPDVDSEITLETLIRVVKDHPPFNNLMIASSLVWNMIPSSAKQQVTELADKFHLHVNSEFGKGFYLPAVIN
jgi:hypothetical protein